MDTESVKNKIRNLIANMEFLHPADARKMREEVRDLEILLILSWLWMCPFASVKDLEGFVDLFKLAKINNLLEEAVAAGLMACVRQGKTFSTQRRFFLDLKGLYRVRDYYRIPLEWQVTEEGVKRLAQRLRMVEAFYRVLPGLWRSAALEKTMSFYLDPDPESPPMNLDERMRLVRFQWVRQGPTHAVAWYQTWEGREVWFPVHWYGIHHNDKTTGDDLEDFVEGPKTSRDFWRPAPASPPGLIIVAIDALAAYRAKRLFLPTKHAAIVTPEGRILLSMKPSCPSGSVHATSDSPGRLGKPLRIAAWLETPQMAAMDGVTSRKALEWVESWPGSRTVDVANGIGQPRSKTTEILNALKVPLEDLSKPNSKPHRLVQEMERGQLHLGTAGMLEASRRDRASYKKPRRTLGSYLDTEGHWRRSQSKHNAHVVKLAIRFGMGKERMVVAPGWRLTINYHDQTQIAPDLWLEVPWMYGLVLWHCVEYEQSAKNEGTIHNKLNTYRTALKTLGEPWPILMICKTEEAAKMFELLGDDLLMLVAAYDDVMDQENHAFAGETPVWRYRGTRVHINHLVGQMVADGIRPDLFELADSWAERDTDHLRRQQVNA